MNDHLYEETKALVLAAITQADDRTTLSAARHLAHDATFEIFQLVCAHLRDLDEVTLESALFQLGQRP